MQDFTSKLTEAMSKAGLPEYICTGAEAWAERLRESYSHLKAAYTNLDDSSVDDIIVETIVREYINTGKEVERYDIFDALDCIDDAYCDLADIIGGNTKTLARYLNSDIRDYIPLMHWQRYRIWKFINDSLETFKDCLTEHGSLGYDRPEEFARKRLDEITRIAKDAIARAKGETDA